jgi:hypothetical protein
MQVVVSATRLLVRLCCYGELADYSAAAEAAATVVVVGRGGVTVGRL